ncbi:MAG TPA: hypothetical protein VFG43_11625, partial [Geminicoccaceae bacterium]|nr:hypothetical protein [Geminicoccaceae bacterium]
LRLADWLLWLVMGRPIVLIEDLPLALSLIEIGRDSMGGLPIVALGLVALLPIALYWLLAAGVLGTVARLPRRRVVGVAVLAAAVVGELARPLGDGRPGPLWPFGRHGVQVLQQQAERTQAAWAAAGRWTLARGTDPVLAVPPEARLARLAGIDVVLVFVESYGRTALEAEPFRDRLRMRLGELGAALDDAGLVAASGWLVSPTVGGQSWLAHATLASGVRTADQGSHAAYLGRAGGDLAHLFAAAGHRTALLSPAIVHAYPEAAGLGFEELRFADALEYAGPRPGWVTMPDQYTLAALERLVRAERPPARPPLFATVVLVGSHAPFTPLPPLIADWDAIGDGRIYAALPLTGDSPAATWASPAALRQAYTDAVDLSLGAVGLWAHRFVDRHTLAIVVGDHEPAALISGEPDAREVPMHVIAGDPALLEPFLAWGFTPGLVPAATAPARPMEAFRAFFVAAFSGPTPAGRIARLP